MKLFRRKPKPSTHQQQQEGLWIGNCVPTRRSPTALPFRLPSHGEYHSLRVGPTRVGKSYETEVEIREKWRQGEAVFVTDPHGSLVDSLLNFVAHNPDLPVRDKLLVFSPRWLSTLGFNPFAKKPGADISVQVSNNVDAIAVSTEGDIKIMPSFKRAATNIFYCLVENNQSINQAVEFTKLGPSSVRNKLVAQVSNSRVRSEWRDYEKMSIRDRQALMLSTQNRIIEFVDNEVVRLCLRHSHFIDTRRILNEGISILWDISPRGAQLAPDNGLTIGSLGFSDLIFTAFAQSEDEIDARANYHIFIDEASLFAGNKSLLTLLSQAGKFKLWLHLITQHLAQIRLHNAELADSLLTNTYFKLCFGGLPATDVEILEKELFGAYYNPHHTKQEVWHTAHDGQELTSRQYVSLPEQQYKKRELLKKLPRFHAVVKMGQDRPSVIKIRSVQEYPRDDEKLQALQEHIVATYPEYYLTKDAARKAIDDHQRQLEAPEQEEDDPTRFHDTKPLRPQRRNPRRHSENG